MRSLLFILFSALTLSSSAQQKDSIPFKMVGDTLIVSSNVKFVRIAYSNTTSIEAFSDAGLWLPYKYLASILEGVQDFPAKCANPITDYLYKVFKLK